MNCPYCTNEMEWVPITPGRTRLSCVAEGCKGIPPEQPRVFPRIKYHPQWFRDRPLEANEKRPLGGKMDW